MKVKYLLEQQKNNPYWKTGKVFWCYSYDKISRMRAEGKNICDGELFNPEDLTEDMLDSEPEKVWIEDGDLCIDIYK